MIQVGTQNTEQGRGGTQKAKKGVVDAMAQVMEVQKHWSEGWGRKSMEET